MNIDASDQSNQNISPDPSNDDRISICSQDTWTGSSSTEKSNSSPHMGFLEPGIIELHQARNTSIQALKEKEAA